MVWIPEGTFLMGTDDVSSFPNERPAHRVHVEGFSIDDCDVTNAEFAKFVDATGYVTTAERKPDWEELKKELPPDTPKPDDGMLVAGSLVFTPTAHPVPLDDLSAWWRWVPGACWRHPEGPGSGIEGRENHPVVQVSWYDAVAYAKWAAQHSARRSWVYIDGEVFQGMRADVAGDPKEPWVSIAWKYLYTAKDSWLGPTQSLGSIGALYNLTMDPYEKYDMVFNGAGPARALTTSPGKFSGEDNGWALAVLSPVFIDFDKTLMKFPNIRRSVGGASTDLIPDLQHPDNPVPLLKQQIQAGKEPHATGGAD